MPSTRDRLLQILIDTRAFQFSPTPIFKLASGSLSSFYVDCRLALSHAECREIVGELMLERIGPVNAGAVGGLLIGAYPIAIAVSDAAHRRRKGDLRVFVVRKEPKGHGLNKLIEGDVKPGERAVIVDDVITSGGSTLEAIRKCREFGLVVARAIAIVDREEQGGRQRIEAEGVPADALCTLQDLRGAVEARTGA
jgi:orotate phosphoribosyltransferase